MGRQGGGITGKGGGKKDIYMAARTETPVILLRMGRARYQKKLDGEPL